MEAKIERNREIYEKRLKGAIDNLEEIGIAATELRRKYNKASKYYNDTIKEYEESLKILDDILTEVN